MIGNVTTSRRSVIFSAASLISAAPLGLASCNRDQKLNDVVLYLTLTLGNPFYQEMIAGLKRGLKGAPGWRLEAQAGQHEDDATGQRQIMEGLLVQHERRQGIRLRGLVLVPANTRFELTDAIRQYNKAGIPIINVDVPMDSDALSLAGARTSSFIGASSFQGGEEAADVMSRALPKGGKILILTGPPGSSNARDRSRGFRDRIARRGIGAFEFQEWIANFNRSEALTATSTLLAGGRHIDGIFAENDLMALGAAQAIDAANLGRHPRPIVIGYDAIPEAREAIREGRLFASISQNPDIMGDRAANRLITLSQGGKIPSKEIIPVTAIVKNS